jgi:hypothetical protein
MSEALMQISAVTKTPLSADDKPPICLYSLSPNTLISFLLGPIQVQIPADSSYAIRIIYDFEHSLQNPYWVVRNFWVFSADTEIQRPPCEVKTI